LQQYFCVTIQKRTTMAISSLRLSAAILLLCCFATPLFAQSPYTVVAASGLKLRATPDQNGKVLAIAPFGAQVMADTTPKHDGYERFSIQPKARRDTIGIFNQYTAWNGTALETVRQLHTGYWWSVRYKGKAGYMFSGFLANKEELGTDYYPELNEQWRVMAPGGNACASTHVDLKKAWFWYGLFRTSGGKYALRAVQLRYVVADYTDEQGHFDLLQRELIILAADVPEQPLFLIGKREPWTERSNISGDEAYPVVGKMSRFVWKDGAPNAAMLRSYGVIVEKTADDRYPSNFLSLGDQNGKRQKLTLHYPGQDYSQPPSELLWTGDLDGDGRNDYLFNAPGEIGAYMLYLSSQAKKGEIAGLVALMWHWYCC
jgi:hypothetical protein